MALRLVDEFYESDDPWPSKRETDADRIVKYGWASDVRCTFCGDQGMLPGTAMPCHCPTGEQMYAMERRRARWNETIPARFRGYTLEGHPNTDLAMQVARWVDDQPNGQNLVITGPVGCGKTGAAIGALREFHLQGLRVRYGSLPDVLDQVRKDEFGRDDEPMLPQLIACDVLLLDDLGTERTHSEFVTDRLYLLINGRYVAGKPTMFTTNFGLTQFRKYLGDRVASRICEDVLEIEAKGRDLRRAK